MEESTGAAVQSVMDYFSSRITRQEAIEMVMAYFRMSAPLLPISNFIACGSGRHYFMWAVSWSFDAPALPVQFRYLMLLHQTV